MASAILFWVPPEEILAWAENHLEIPEGSSRFSGKFRFGINPYMRGPLIAWASGHFPEVWLVWGAQTGKTLAMQIAIAYVIDQIPGPLMVTYPDQATAKKRSDNHLRPFLTLMEYMRRNCTGREDDVSTFNMKFLKAILRIGWAGSGSSMAAESIQYGFGDEAAKWERRDKKEAHPLKLFQRRLIGFGDAARAMYCTTPNTEDRPGWRDLENSTFHECFIPCPHCGKTKLVEHLPELVVDQSQEELKPLLKKAGYQTLRWGNFEGFTGEHDPEKVENLTVYVCERCGKRISNASKVDMLNDLRWIPRYPGRRRAGFHLPSWYSRMVEFGHVARRFIESKSDPEQFQDWVNSDCAEPFREQGIKKTKDEILAHVRDYPSGTIPFVPVLISLTVDVQEDEFYYVFGAWGENETFAVIKYGMLPRLGRKERKKAELDTSFDIFNEVMGRTFFGPNGLEYPLDFAGYDSGFDEVQVYSFVKRYPHAAAMHGQDAQKAILNYSRPESTTMPNGQKRSDPDSANLISWNTNYFRNLLSMRLEVPAGDPGSFSLPADTEDEFAYQMCGMIKKKQRGRWIWAKAHREHYFDCIVMQYVIAKMLEVKDMKVQPPAPQAQQSSPRQESRESNWIKRHH